jgi:hypothetical protein
MLLVGRDRGSSAGYSDWVQMGVIVRPEDCHVNGVQLAARLQVGAVQYPQVAVDRPSGKPPPR